MLGWNLMSILRRLRPHRHEPTSDGARCGYCGKRVGRSMGTADPMLSVGADRAVEVPIICCPGAGTMAHVRSCRRHPEYEPRSKGRAE